MDIFTHNDDELYDQITTKEFVVTYTHIYNLILLKSILCQDLFYLTIQKRR
jgi:hypothetical protein